MAELRNIFREDEDLIKLTPWFFDNDKPIASVCHGVKIPARADRVKGRRMATVAKCQFDLNFFDGIYVNEPCVIDGNLVSERTFHDTGHSVDQNAGRICRTHLILILTKPCYYGPP